MKSALASFQEVDTFKVLVELQLNEEMQENVTLNFDKEDSLSKFKFTPVKILESKPAKEAEIDKKLNLIQSDVSQIKIWMCGIKDSFDRLSNDVGVIKGEVAGEESKSNDTVKKVDKRSRDKVSASLQELAPTHLPGSTMPNPPLSSTGCSDQGGGSISDYRDTQLDGQKEMFPNLDDICMKVLTCLDEIKERKGKEDREENLTAKEVNKLEEKMENVIEAKHERGMWNAVSSEIASLREDLESSRYDQKKDLELLRDDIQENTEGLRKLFYKRDTVDDLTVQMKSLLDFVSEMKTLQSKMNSSENEVICKLDKLQSNFNTNKNLIVEVKDIDCSDFERALRKEVTGQFGKLHKHLSDKNHDSQGAWGKIDQDFQALRKDMVGQFSKLYKNLSENDHEKKSYDTIEGLQWVWGKIDQDFQSLSKLFEDQVEAHTLVMLDNMNQKSVKNIEAPECPYCMEEMRPPGRIFQCLIGHLICEKCLASPSIRDCPTCSQKIIGRNRGLESVLEL